MTDKNEDCSTDPIFAVLADFIEKQKTRRALEDTCACGGPPSPDNVQACAVHASWIAAYTRLVQTRPTSFLGARDLLDWAIEELEDYYQLDRGATLWPALYLVRQFLETKIEGQDDRTALAH